MFDNHPNLARGIVQTAPSPTTSGTTIILQTGHGAAFAEDTPCTFSPADVEPTIHNSEIGYITSVADDTIVVVRGQEGTTPQVVQTGWIVRAVASAKTFTDIENATGNANTSSTVGLTTANFTYNAGMTPTHYSDAINSALAATTSGEVFLRGETVGFTSASGKVVTPVSNTCVRGSGIDKTVINTARTDYVFRNTTNALTNFTLSDMTINCQNITNVSGAEVRKFTDLYIERMKFKNSTKWFLKGGNEPAASTTDMNDGLHVKDSIFDTHDGIYEMLLVNNTNNITIENSQFKNKTGSSGAAPVIGLWQKVDHVNIHHCKFSELVSSAIYYGYTTNNITVSHCDFINTGQALRGGIVSDFGKFGVKEIKNLRIDNFTAIGGSNSATTEAIQIGSVNGFTIDKAYISDYGKGIRIGFGNNVPTASDGGDAHYLSSNGSISNVIFRDINSAAGNVNLNSPIYFGNGGDFGHLTIRDIKVQDPEDYLDYAVIFNGAVTGTVSVSGGAVTGISIVNNYAWYSTAPTVTITGDGTGATATASIDSDGHLTGFTITDGGSGYTSATVSVQGANYKNITFINCDFGGKQIRLNDSVQIDTDTVKFVNCKNFDTTNLSSALVDKTVTNNTGIVMRDGKLAVAMNGSEMNSNTDVQIGDGSEIVTMRLNNVQIKNSNDNIQIIFSSFTGKTETWYFNGTDLADRRLVFDVDTGQFLANGVDANLGTDMTIGGLVAKRLTTTERDAIASPQVGTIIWNTTTSQLEKYASGAWSAV